MHQRRSIRLEGYNYAQEGAYFVTICTQNRADVLGRIVDGAVQLNDSGDVVNKYWLEISDHFPNAEADGFVIMPNHFHGILIIQDRRGEAHDPAQKGAVTAPLRQCTLGQIIAYFKYQTTKAINQIHNATGVPFWQRNYYEHVIRNETDLNEIRQYILDNPVKWDLDEENPNRRKMHNKRNANHAKPFSHCVVAIHDRRGEVSSPTTKGAVTAPLRRRI